jgi:hypothetical protein
MSPRSIFAFGKEVWKDGWALFFVVLFPLVTGLTWIRDEFFPAYADRYKILKLLPHWPFVYWITALLLCGLILAVRTGARLWKEKEELNEKSLQTGPDLTLDYGNFANGGKTFVLRNAGQSPAVNVKPKDASVAGSKITFATVATLQPKSEARLQAHFTANAPGQPSTFERFLMQTANERQDAIEGRLEVAYEDLQKRAYVSSWCIRCRDASVDEFGEAKAAMDIDFLGRTSRAN